MPQPICHMTTESGIPLEQAISRQRLRPGSGFLDVEIITDGPTKVLKIWDKKEKDTYSLSNSRHNNHIANQQSLLLTDYDDQYKKHDKEYQFMICLAGLGVSLISRKPVQELLFAHLKNIVGETYLTAEKKKFCISVENIQIDNQVISFIKLILSV